MKNTIKKYSKSSQIFRWIQGASTCIFIIPVEKENLINSEIRQNNENTIYDDWNTAFEPLAIALNTREKELKTSGVENEQ